MYHTAVDNTSRMRLKAKQLLVHLLRLEELYLERFTLTEKSTKLNIELNRDLILTDKTQEAHVRATAVARKLRELLNSHERRVDAPHVSVAARAATQFVDFSSTDSEVEQLHFIDSTLLAAGVEHTAEWSPILAQWLRYHYVARYTKDYLPNAGTLTMVRCSLAHEDAQDLERRRQKEEGQRRQVEYERGREVRRIQFLTAQQRLDNAQRNVFSVRKRIFVLYERLTGRRSLPSGEKLDGLISHEILRRIQEDIIAGDLDFILLLSTDDGRALQEMLLNRAPRS